MTEEGNGDRNTIGFDKILEDSPHESKKLDQELQKKEAEKGRFSNLVVPLKNKDLSWFKQILPPRPAFLTTLEGSLIVPRGRVGIVAGQGGVGKTKFILQMIVCCATGKTFQERLKPQDVEGDFLYLFGEEDEDEAQYRLQETYHTLKLSDNDLKNLKNRLDIVPLQGVHANFFDDSASENDKFEHQILAHIRESAKNGRKYAAIIFDPISRFMPEGGENDNTIATKFIATFEKMTKREYGSPTVLLSHHVNKDSLGGVQLFNESEDKHQGAVRGASGLVDGCRFVLSVDTIRKEPWMAETKFAETKLIKTCLPKGNYGPGMLPILSYFDERGVIVPLSDEDLEELREAQGESKNSSSKSAKSFKERFGATGKKTEQTSDDDIELI